MSTGSCAVIVEFEDLKLGEPLLITLNCDQSSEYFEYYLRKELQRKSRVPPIDQHIDKISNDKYKLKIRNRGNFASLTVHGHFEDEYHLQIDPEDTVIDLKCLLSPLIDANPEYIQLNYNTIRRLKDDENLIKSNCLSPSVKIMWWLEIENINNKNKSKSQRTESPIYRATSHLVGVHPLYPNMATTVRRVCNKYGDTKTFGIRKYLDENDLTLRGEYEYIDYNIINDKITKIAAAYRHLGLNKKKESKIGLCGRNRREWALCDYASSLQSIINVPLYATLDHNAIEYITNHAQIELIVVDKERCGEIYDLRMNKKAPSLKYIILMDYELPDQLWAKENSHKFDYTVTDLEKMGQDHMNNNQYKDTIPSLNDICTIMYTSGTTGDPKGVMLSHENLMTILGSLLSFDPDAKKNIKNPVHLSYLPMAHIMEKLLSLWSLLKGRRIGFFNGDHLKLIEDMIVLKPQVMAGVPRIWQRIQDQVVNKIGSSNFIVKSLFNYAYNNKLEKIRNRQQPLWIFEKTLFKKFKDAFGGELRVCISGGAPLSKETAEFLKVCLADSVMEGYGLTESGAGGTGTHEFDLKYGHVGTPNIVSEIKLVSVPSMDYLVTDTPCPRGEIYIRAGSVFVGYYKNKKKTDEVLDAKTGWFKTGDIGLWRSEGRLQIIDRKKNIFKLSQGEYVRPEYIQNIYRGSKFIANVFVYGDSFQSYLVAIIVVDQEALQFYFGVDGLLDINDPKVIDLIKNDLKIQEDKVKLNGFERVKKFKLISDDFTLEDGLITTSMKLKRNACKIKFQKDIDKMYAKKSKL